MRLPIFAILLIAWLSLLYSAMPVAAYNATKRATDAAASTVLNIPNGLLLENDTQTFCQVMIVTNNAGVAAASCFEYNDNGSVDATPYSVVVGNGGIDGALKLTINSIEKHPAYDPKTFANNLAVVTFSAISAEGVTYRVGDLPLEWPSFYYVHRTLLADQATWNEPTVIEDSFADTIACGEASPIYKANSADYFCTTTTRVSFTDSNCVLPYKYVVGSSSVGNAQLGFYSHSAIAEDTGFCAGSDTNTIYNYYILLAHYIPWINSKIDPELTAYHNDPTNFKDSSDSYSMNADITYTGDEPGQYSLFKLNEVVKGDLSGASQSQSSSSSSSSSSSGYDSGATTVYSTKYKTVYKTSTTTIHDGDATASATATTTTTTTEYNDAFTIVYQTDTVTETVTEAGELTVTLADGETCPAVSACETSYIGPGRIEVVTSTVTEVSTAAEATVTIVDVVDMDNSNSNSYVSSFLAVTVTVTVAETTIYETVGIVVGTETIVVTATEDASEGLGGLDDDTESTEESDTVSSDSTDDRADSSGNTGSENNSNDAQSSADDQNPDIVSATLPGDGDNTSNSDELGSETEDSSDATSLGSNDEQSESNSSKGLPLAAIIGIVAGVVVILAAAGYFIFRWWKNKKANAVPVDAEQDDAPGAIQPMNYAPQAAFNPYYGDPQSAYGMQGPYNTAARPQGY